MEKITFITEDGENISFYPEEQTVIGGVTYLLVSDSQEEEANVYIMKEISASDSEEVCYEMVEDEVEQDAVFRVFEQMLEEEVDLVK